MNSNAKTNSHSASNANSTSTTAAKKKDQKQNVLFQKLGKKWYAFTEGKDDLLFTPLPDGIDPMKQDFEFFSVMEEKLKQDEDEKIKTQNKANLKELRKKRTPSPVAPS